MHTGEVVKRQNNKKSTQWCALGTINWFPWSFLKVTGESRCASKGIHWYHTSSNSFSYTVLDKYIGIVCTVQKML